LVTVREGVPLEEATCAFSTSIAWKKLLVVDDALFAVSA